MARKLRSPSNRAYRLSRIRKQQWQQRQKQIKKQQRRDAEYEKYKADFERNYKNYVNILGKDFDKVTTLPKALSKSEYFAQKVAHLNDKRAGKIHFKVARTRIINEQMGNVISHSQAQATFAAMQDEGFIDADAKFNYATAIKLRSGIFEMQEEWYQSIKDYRAELFEQGYSKREVRNMVSREYYGSPK